MTAISRTRSRKQKILSSVFPLDVSQPTPALPALEPGAPFGGPLADPSRRRKHAAALRSSPVRGLRKGQHDEDSSSYTATDQIRWDRAWHAVTSRIELPSSVAAEDSFGTLPPQSQDDDGVIYEALTIVLDPQTQTPGAVHVESILNWHMQQIRQHFGNHVLPLLAACSAQESHESALLASIRTLEAAHRQYLYGLSIILRGMRDKDASSTALNRFRKDLHAIIGDSWTPDLTDALHSILRKLLKSILQSRTVEKSKRGSQADPVTEIAEAKKDLLSLVDSLHKVGLAGEKFQVLVAELMDACMQDFIRDSYAGVWDSQDGPKSVGAVVLSGCMANLADWIENQYGRLAVELFGRIGGEVGWGDVERWKEVAIGRLATLRIHELFDLVLHWPKSKGGIEDLRTAVTTPQRRLQLTDIFSATLQRRLLHSGRSTLEILQTYISMIRTFHALDHSKVLLDRVVHALQLYLCQRDDAIRIVVTGLLSGPDQGERDGARQDQLVELASILNEASQQQRRHHDEDDLDWNDMTWVPDPVDAGVNYKRPKNEDVIGTLISALGSGEIFIKEFQAILGERLLSKQITFPQEAKVLALLKKRFGEGVLQNCDVMTKDIQDSKRVDSTIGKAMRRDFGQSLSPTLYHAKILSRLFWPSLPKEPFQVPPPIAAIQERYEAGFEGLKSSRKLTWLDHLGSATVSLEFEDRSLDIECTTYEAAVIYAFQDAEDNMTSQPVQLTFDYIWQKLMIDEDLLEAALRFWVSKRVLRDMGDKTFVVIENLGADGAAGSEGDAAELTGGDDDNAQGSPRKPKNMDSKEKERRAVYWQFIVGMLTNSGPAMPLGQIAMMMKMLIADGCPWSNEELQEFLGEKIAEGDLEFSGGKYRLPKK